MISRLFCGDGIRAQQRVLSNEGKIEMSLIANRFEEDSAAFDARFQRCYSMLRLIASRFLSSPEWAEKAVGNCWYTASRYSPRFEYEGAFRSWLLRILIDEALALLRENQQTPKPKVSLEPVPEEVFPGERHVQPREQHS